MNNSAVTLFEKRGREKNASSGNPAQSADTMASGKHKIYLRNKILTNPDTPAHVLQKWKPIESLKGRDRNKNKQKTKFTDMILADCKYEDSYWQDDVVDSWTDTHDQSGLWQMRAAVDTAHGGGSQGHQAVQNATDAGTSDVQ